ncbi:MAG TPA: M56 family metallopeptidase [Pirellulales bacterium]|nr:M56 family metallopeptidase [Pirellulales bacterium]
MNALGISLVWMALQTSLFCLAATGLYLFARRRHPALGASTLCGVLLITVGIATLSFGPWPRWRTLADLGPTGPTADAAAKTELHRAEQSSSPISASAADADSASDHGASPPNAGVLNLLSGIWGAVRSQVQNQLDVGSRVDLNAHRWRWPAWLAAVMLAGVGIGLARMLVGLFALARLLRETQLVSDPSLVGLLDELRAKLGCRRPIELREMAGARAGGSPAVVGWRRPVILLPADWRSWSAEVRRGILAHETSHVAHCDFLKWLAAQAGVVLHFYNPLVHWLARRLRLEQELAADACGAALAGGAKAYATVLAQMALQQDPSRPLWAGSPFFPSRGTLMRRIEMLDNPRFITERSPSRLGLTALLTTLALVGLGVSGFRGPTAAAQAAEPPAKAESAETASTNASDALLPAFDRSYLPAETIAVISVKPLAVAHSPIVAEPAFCVLPNAIGFGFGLFEKSKTRSFEVEEFHGIMLQGGPCPEPFPESPAALEAAEVMIYRMRRPYEPGKLRDMLLDLAADDVTETVCNGHKCFRTGSEDAGKVIDYLMVDDRTIVVLREQDVARVLAADPQSHPAWYGQWQEAAASPVAVGLDSAAMAKLEKESLEPKDAAEQLFVSILKETSLLFAHADSTAEGLKISVTAHCQSPEKTAATNQIAQAALAATLKVIPPLVTPSSLPKEFEKIDVSGSLVQTLSAWKLKVAGTQVQAEATLGAEFTSQVFEALKAYQDAYAEKMKQEHLTKLGRLAEAFNAYHAAHGHYPPAAVLGPDGKTLHSWRVELLPYLGEQKLFESYKLDEPWDGERNKQLVEKMPEIYSTRQSTPKGAAEYYVVTGKGTLFDGNSPATRESISDAPGETILVMQSRRRIPWTKPLDIDSTALDAPARGQRNGFYAAFADGTVRFVEKETDAASVRAMFTKAGGDEVKLR